MNITVDTGFFHGINEHYMIEHSHHLSRRRVDYVFHAEASSEMHYHAASHFCGQMTFAICSCFIHFSLFYTVSPPSFSLVQCIHVIILTRQDGRPLLCLYPLPDFQILVVYLITNQLK